MKTIRAVQGDVVKFPNGMEVNYDAVTESLVVLTTLNKRHLTLHAENGTVEKRAGGINVLHMSKGVWLLGSDV